MFIPDPESGFFFLTIPDPDPGVKKALDSGSRIGIRNTVKKGLKKNGTQSQTCSEQ